jgi:hypothetical protein
LYARQEEFKSLWRRVGEYYAGRFFGVTAGGYSYRVFCAAYADARDPTAIPPELCHEITHVWLWQRAALPNDGNWLSEGLAMAVQARFFPASINRAEWAARVAAGRYLPLKRLMTTQPIAPENYWQACTLAETLLAQHPKDCPNLVRAVAEGRGPQHVVTEVLRTDWLGLERRWTTDAAAAPNR